MSEGVSHDHIRIGEEANTGDQANFDVEPSMTQGEKGEGKR